FLLLVVGTALPVFLVALALLGTGLGLVRPGASAAASLAVEAHEQGSAAGILGGVAVAGNVIGPMLGTALYELSNDAPYLLNVALLGATLVLVLTSRRVRQVRA
ncbi:MAG: MFS transporter, partial [Thermodesulfobacteriota bacterium]